MGPLKFNLSFKQNEAELYKLAVVDQRAPAALIKDAIEFYLKYLKEQKVSQMVSKLPTELEEKSEESDVKTSDLLDF